MKRSKEKKKIGRSCVISKRSRITKKKRTAAAITSKIVLRIGPLQICGAIMQNCCYSAKRKCLQPYFQVLKNSLFQH